jgi:hypothetical protein
MRARGSVLMSVDSLEGKISLNPSAIAAGPESEITGAELTSHRNFHLLLQSQRRPTAEEAMSADEWLAAHPELPDRRRPPIIEAREAKVRATAEHFKQAEEDTARAGSTSFTEYPERERIGYGDHTRYSFPKLLDSLSSVDFARRVNEDPQFAAAFDRLRDGKK